MSMTDSGLPSLAPYHFKPCPYCGKIMGDGSDRGHWAPTRDHLVPPWRGGSRISARNLIVVCAQCNNEKGSHTLPEWLDMLKAAGDVRAARIEAIITEPQPSAYEFREPQLVTA